MGGPWYVDDGGNDTTGLSWANAYITLQSLLTAEAPLSDGDFIYLGHTHTEGLGSSQTYTFNGGEEDDPIKLISSLVDSSPPTYQIGAEINITGAGNDIAIGVGNLTWDGIKFTAPDNFTPGAFHDLNVYHNCEMDVVDLIVFVGNSQIKWYGGIIDSEDVAFGGFLLGAGTTFLARGTTISFPNSSIGICVVSSDNACRVTFEDCDFSGCIDSQPLVSYSPTTSNSIVTFRRCRLPPNYVEPAVIPGNNILIVDSCSDGTSTSPFLGVGGDAGNSVWRSMMGDVRTVIAQARTGGATDGVNNYSWEMTAGANASLYAPLESPTITFWAVPGAQTVTIHTADDADLNDNELFMVLEHPDTTLTNAEPTHIVLSTKPVPLATPVAVARDSGSVWSGAGTGTDGSTGQQKLVSSSFNPTVAGPVIIRVYLAKPSAVMYVDRRPVVTRV